MISDTLKFVDESVAEGKRVSLVTVTSTYGSSPASVGQVIAVREDGVHVGTVGGGKTEYKIIQMAVAAIENDEQVFHFKFNHSEEGMVCGGGMEGFGNTMGNSNTLYIFGGGHVSQSLAPIAQSAGFSVNIIEDREELKEYFEGVNYILSTEEEYEEKVQFKGNAYVVICTRGHSGDEFALKFSLRKNTKYTGMIGSKKKVLTTYENLKAEGFTDDEFEKVYAPIGLDIASAIPAEIAVSILAEILLVKNSGTASHKKLK